MVPTGWMLRQKDYLCPEIPCKTKESIRKVVCISLLQDNYVCLCIYVCVAHVVCVHATNYGCSVYVWLYVYTWNTEKKDY